MRTCSPLDQYMDSGGVIERQIHPFHVLPPSPQYQMPYPNFTSLRPRGPHYGGWRHPHPASMPRDRFPSSSSAGAMQPFYSAPPPHAANFGYCQMPPMQQELAKPQLLQQTTPKQDQVLAKTLQMPSSAEDAEPQTLEQLDQSVMVTYVNEAQTIEAGDSAQEHGGKPATEMPQLLDQGAFSVVVSSVNAANTVLTPVITETIATGDVRTEVVRATTAVSKQKDEEVEASKHNVGQGDTVVYTSEALASSATTGGDSGDATVHCIVHECPEAAVV